LLVSWLDGIFEFTILKHEVVVLRIKKDRVVKAIEKVSSEWPKKKQFIEGAYKLILFHKGPRPYAYYLLDKISDLPISKINLQPTLTGPVMPTLSLIFNEKESFARACLEKFLSRLKSYNLEVEP
jgi:hypothetical protein